MNYMGKQLTTAPADAPSAEEFLKALYQVGIDPRDVLSAIWERSFVQSREYPLYGSGWLIETETGRYRITWDFCPFLEDDLPWTLSRA